MQHHHELGEGLLVAGSLQELGRVDGEDAGGDQQPGGLQEEEKGKESVKERRRRRRG